MLGILEKISLVDNSVHRKKDDFAFVTIGMASKLLRMSAALYDTQYLDHCFYIKAQS